MKTEKIYEGSTRTVYALTAEDRDFLLFHFNDTFSVFDWGIMPDLIPGKGINQAHFARICYRALSSQRWMKRLGQKSTIKANKVLQDELKRIECSGFPNAYLEDFPEDWQRPDDFDPQRLLVLQRYQIIHPLGSTAEPDYRNHEGVLGRMIPLEIIFRFGVAKGSSLIKRGYREGIRFAEPMIEFTTKYENQDRSLTRIEAEKISGLASSDFSTLEARTLLLAWFLEDFLGQRGIVLWDGKFEFAIDRNGTIVLADVISPDELRLTVDGIILSKEVLRQNYLGSGWYEAIKQSKNSVRSGEKLRDLIALSPPRLDKAAIEMAAGVYYSLARLLDKPPKTILVLGSGGREHSIVLALRRTDPSFRILVMPGNGGVALDGFSCVDDCSGSSDDFLALIRQYSVDLVIPGAETYLEQGIADLCTSCGIPVFGPVKAAARIESSKIFAKEIFSQAGIPTPPFLVANSIEQARDLLNKFKVLPVLKVDGLAAGKGVLVSDDPGEIELFLGDVFVKHIFGSQRLLLEERLFGPEISLFTALKDDEIVFLGSAQDYKRRNDDDQGPNTGGMGSISPHPLIDDRLADEAVFFTRKIRDCLRMRGLDYRGILFIGGIIVDGRMQVLECNARFGDPEAESLLALEGDKIFDWLINGFSYDGPSSDRVALTIAIVEGDYPKKNAELQQLRIDRTLLDDSDILSFAGCKLSDATLFATSGRVLYLTCIGENLERARDLAYRKLGAVHFATMDYRKDIGKHG